MRHLGEEPYADLSFIPGGIAYAEREDGNMFIPEQPLIARSISSKRSECKYDDLSIYHYAIEAFQSISQEIRKNPSLIKYVTRLAHDVGIDPRFIDI